jgi:3-dehydroquinate synthase
LRVPARIHVATASPYDVVVGNGLLDELPPLLSKAQRVAVIHPTSLGAQAAAAVEALSAFEVAVLPVPDGEASKDLSTAAGLWDQLGAAGFTRSDAVVAVGGGATTDLAGFVAATWLRGVRVVHVPTTLLGMVDAAVGGKTAINTGAGKNLVGAFHEPAGVLCDLDHLETLPRADYVSGLAEVVKVGFTHDPRILELIEDDVPGHQQELIERAIAVKAAVVGDDLTEQGGRETLNYGHTLGHAIEKVEHFGWRHGEAVSVGLVFAAELSGLAAGLGQDVVDRHRTILTALGLPTSYQGDWQELVDVMRVDKKSRGNQLRFVVLEALGTPRLLEGPDDALLRTAWERVSSETMPA